MMAVNLFRRSIGIVSTIILARLLSPADFGLVAMSTVLIVMMQALTEFGFDIALIQKQNATRVHYDTAWTFNVIFAVASFLVLVGMSLPAAEFYADDRVFPIVIALSLGVLLRGFENIGIVDFRKELKFRREFKFQTLIKATATVVTICGAIAFRSYWALVIGTLTSRVVGLVLSYRMHPFRPKFSIAARKDLFSFSVWLYINNILLFVRTRGADFIVGRILGPKSLGLFSIGAEIASLPTRELIAPINRAIYPGYSRISGDLARMRRAFLNVFGVIAMIAIPSATGIAVISDSAIPALLGDNWISAIPLVHTMAFVGLLSSLHSNTGAAYIALGKPRIHVVLQSISVLILLPLAIILAESIGIIGIALAYLCANGTTFVINCFIAVRLMRISPSRAVDSIIRPSIAAALMYAIVASLQSLLLTSMSNLVTMLICALVGGIVYISVVLFLWVLSGRPQGAETFFIEHAERVPIVRRVAARLRLPT